MSRLTLRLYATVIILWLTLPTLIIVPVSFASGGSFSFPPKELSLEWYETVLTDPRWLRAMGNSVLVAVLTTVTATLCGTAAALGLARVRFRGKSLIENLLIAPLIVPSIVLAIGVYAVFIRFGLLGSLFGFVAAHSIVALPLVLMNVAPSIQALDTRLSDASASLGATPLRTFVSVTLPLIMPGVTAGAVLAFVTSFDEVVLAIFIQDAGFRTLPVMIFQSVSQDSSPAVAAISTLMMTVTIVLIMVLQRVSRRKRIVEN